MKITSKILLCLLILVTASSSFGQGFETSSTNWAIPSNIADHTNQYQPSGSDANAQNYSTIDMDGDGKLDFVITSTGINTEVFGTPGNYYWRVYFNNGAGFDSSPTNWPIPSNVADHTNQYQSSGSDANAQNYSTMDIDGDGKPDFVLTSTGINTDVFGTPGNYYWRVYFNNGSGFDSSPTNWPIPSNIADHTSQYQPAGSDANAQNYTTMDIDADGKPDFVHTSTGINTDVFGTPGNYYWRVYFNNGSGFDSSPTNWPIPSNVADHTSQYQPTGSDPNAQNYTTMDIDGDGKPDFVLTSTGINTDVFGTPGNYYWRVYFNDGSGFDSSPTNWTIPSNIAAHTSQYESQGFNPNAQNYATMDMDGDGKPDFVHTSSGLNTDVFGSPGNYYWRVYLNIGSGFNSSPTNWTIPSNIADHTDQYQPSGSDPNAQNYSTMDIDGDGELDFVHTSTGINTDVFGTPGNYYWRVYYNSSFVGIDDPSDTNFSLEMWPNPTTDFLNISLNSKIEEITIFDMTGKMMLKTTDSQVDLQNLITGMYFINILSDDGIILTRKIVKF